MHRYQHQITKEYINVDETGQLYSSGLGRFVLLTINNARRILVPNLLQTIADGTI